MIVIRQEFPETSICLNNQQIGRLNVFKYIGAILIEQLDIDRKSKQKIATRNNLQDEVILLQ